MREVEDAHAVERKTDLAERLLAARALRSPSLRPVASKPSWRLSSPNFGFRFLFRFCHDCFSLDGELLFLERALRIEVADAAALGAGFRDR
jgi:hypothetical protein